MIKTAALSLHVTTLIHAILQLKSFFLQIITVFLLFFHGEHETQGFFAYLRTIVYFAIISLLSDSLIGHAYHILAILFCRGFSSLAVSQIFQKYL